jgi:hypothetical protein
VTERPAVLRLTRLASPFRDRFRAYRVLLDGKETRRLVFGETVEIEVEPGQHRLQIRIDWSGSNERHVTVKAGECAEFVCRPSGAAWSAWRTVLSKTGWVVLEPAAQEGSSGVRQVERP